jgi:hypothetical protein
MSAMFEITTKMTVNRDYPYFPHTAIGHEALSAYEGGFHLLHIAYAASDEKGWLGPIAYGDVSVLPTQKLVGYEHHWLMTVFAARVSAG